MQHDVVPLENKNAVHLILQGKGGVGKSLVAAILAQYLSSKEDIKCIDTDPVNHTLSYYKTLSVINHTIIDEHSKINPQKFDFLLEELLSKEGVFVIDNGASSFVPLTNYLVESNAIELLEEAGKTVFIHTVISGGQGFIDTVSGFVSLARQTHSKNMIVWINEYFGNAVSEGKSFKETRGFIEHQSQVLGCIHLKKLNPDTFGKDMEKMNSLSLTFNEAIQNKEFLLMSKQRIKMIRQDLFSQLDAVSL